MACRFLGGAGGAPLVHTQVIWEKDPWARGAYAVITPHFDPQDRDLLGRAAGRVQFAGEHTSRDAQGYMEGAVESGDRVAADVRVALAARLADAGPRLRRVSQSVGRFVSQNIWNPLAASTYADRA